MFNLPFKHLWIFEDEEGYSIIEAQTGDVIAKTTDYREARSFRDGFVDCMKWIFESIGPVCQSLNDTAYNLGVQSASEICENYKNA